MPKSIDEKVKEMDKIIENGDFQALGMLYRTLLEIKEILILHGLKIDNK